MLLKLMSVKLDENLPRVVEINNAKYTLQETAHGFCLSIEDFLDLLDSLNIKSPKEYKAYYRHEGKRKGFPPAESIFLFYGVMLKDIFQEKPAIEYEDLIEILVAQEILEKSDYFAKRNKIPGLPLNPIHTYGLADWEELLLNVAEKIQDNDSII